MSKGNIAGCLWQPVCTLARYPGGEGNDFGALMDYRRQGLVAKATLPIFTAAVAINTYPGMENIDAEFPIRFNCRVRFKFSNFHGL